MVLSLEEVGVLINLGGVKRILVDVDVMQDGEILEL
jgi:hypothetical protein